MAGFHSAIAWLCGIVEDAGGSPSAKRSCLLIATICLGASCVILSVAAYIGKSVGVEIASIAAALGGLTGTSYIQGKKTESSSPQPPEITHDN